MSSATGTHEYVFPFAAQGESLAGDIVVLDQKCIFPFISSSLFG